MVTGIVASMVDEACASLYPWEDDEAFTAAKYPNGLMSVSGDVWVSVNVLVGIFKIRETKPEPTTESVNVKLMVWWSLVGA